MSTLLDDSPGKVNYFRGGNSYVPITAAEYFSEHAAGLRAKVEEGGVVAVFYGFDNQCHAIKRHTGGESRAVIATPCSWCSSGEEEYVIDAGETIVVGMMYYRASRHHVLRNAEHFLLHTLLKEAHSELEAIKAELP